MSKTESDLHGMTVGARHGGFRVSDTAVLMVLSVTTCKEAVSSSGIGEIKEQGQSRLASREYFRKCKMKAVNDVHKNISALKQIGAGSTPVSY